MKSLYSSTRFNAVAILILGIIIGIFDSWSQSIDGNVSINGSRLIKWVFGSYCIALILNILSGIALRLGKINQMENQKEK
ncbi:hypothetical protein KZ483_17195 [Paenibacillus sp. sptzw28]|uniref:hypothetical protein n=1 Tax=Paenibacillus sp. sptzw28 TaxID=715179 RepID=UPI001C6EA173|nr:hypothetical protein [Paenibacillus sp. sptzw28]QYR19629.1 hypothetical protein KZ483_17195 [Paenibacillus sp. sptzw28]